jgi:Glycosyltransferase family 92
VSAYLSVCAIYRNEAPYLAEWIEFHRLVGAERFFLYDNNSTDRHEAVLAPYVSDGIAVVYPWPQHPGQQAAYDHCLAQHGGESRWIAFLDVDEFLFSPQTRPVAELLPDYEQWAAVGVNRVMFGTSGHKEKPDGLAIESYVMKWPAAQSIKSIVDPGRTVRCLNPHAFIYREGDFAVDEHKRPIDGWFTDEFTVEHLRINHYYTRSEAEFREKLRHVRADNAKLREQPKNWARTVGREKDDAITAYVPAVRDAIAARTQGAGAPEVTDPGRVT